MTMEPLRTVALGGGTVDWDALAEAAGDVYYQRDYLRAAALHEAGELCLVHYCGEGGIVLYPLVRRPLEALSLPGQLVRGRFDLTTPYEYGGPLLICEHAAEQAVRAGFLRAFDAWCRDTGVVSEFVRFDPLLAVHFGWGGVYDLRSCGSNVVIDLSRDDATLLAQMRGAARRAVLAAQRRGCRVEYASARSGDFASLYRANLDRLGAGAQYYLSTAYFADLAVLGCEDRLAVAFGPNGEIAGAALFVVGRLFAHYHLAAVDRTMSSLNPGHLLIYEAARRLRDSGRRWLHLGGAAPSQSGLRAFKESFSPDRMDYVVGTRVHDAVTYRALAEAAGAAGARFFPAYRTPTLTASVAA
jgi:hypothetical protein